MAIGEVVVVAPDSPAVLDMGTAITIDNTCILKSLTVRYRKWCNKKNIVCSGGGETPARLVKLWLQNSWTEAGFYVSVDHHGSNSLSTSLYSGTMSAAIEQESTGIRPIGFSLCDYS